MPKYAKWLIALVAGLFMVALFLGAFFAGRAAARPAAGNTAAVGTGTGTVDQSSRLQGLWQTQGNAGVGGCGVAGAGGCGTTTAGALGLAGVGGCAVAGGSGCRAGGANGTGGTAAGNCGTPGGVGCGVNGAGGTGVGGCGATGGGCCGAGASGNTGSDQPACHTSGGTGVFAPLSGTPLTIAQARQAVETYIASTGNTDLTIAEVIEFERNFYALVKEKSTNIGAIEVLVDKPNGTVRLEPGPNVMWNARYGAAGNGGAEAMRLSPEAARTAAQSWLDQNMPGVETRPNDLDPFYGYYTLHVWKDGNIYGMLSVNGDTGQVWYHSWHGAFVAALEGEGD